MADFKTPNLCGANEALNNASSKINDIKAEIECPPDSAKPILDNNGKDQT